jgi:hypothetical protein
LFSVRITIRCPRWLTPPRHVSLSRHPTPSRYEYIYSSLALLMLSFVRVCCNFGVIFLKYCTGYLNFMRPNGQYLITFVVAVASRGDGLEIYNCFWTSFAENKTIQSVTHLSPIRFSLWFPTMKRFGTFMRIDHGGEVRGSSLGIATTTSHQSGVRTKTHPRGHYSFSLFVRFVRW